MLLGVEAAFDFRMQDAGGHGIIDFELAGSLEHSRRILEFWGHDGHAAARLSLWFDFLYLISYGAFWALAVASVRDMARRLGWRRFARVGTVLVAFPIAAAAFDATENVGLLLALGRHAGAFAPRLASVCATAKFILIEIAILFVIVALVRRALERWPVVTSVGLGAVLLALMAFVADGIVAVNRTRAATAGAGTIVRQPGGDLNVSDQGPRRSSALVLVHGWASSMNWWEAAARPLARRFRVIRVDLLGFGASSKPGSGYSMDHQARLVLGTMRRLGVKRAVVVGHSMGGAVAVSMAQQSPGRIAGLAVVDTPPRNDSGVDPPTDRLLRIPLVGPALFDITPDSIIRNRLRSAFARGFKVPTRFVRDLRRATFRSLARSGIDFHDFIATRRLDERARSTGKPLLVIYGRGEREVDPRVASAWFVPGARIVGVSGAGHSPQVERPVFTAGLIAGFAGPLLKR